MSKNIKVALIGCGRIGFLLEEDHLRNKPCSHFGGAQSVGLKINYACDIDRKRLSKFANLANIEASHCYTNYEILLETIKPSIVIIATWTENHHLISIKAAQNYAKIIILEKPIANNLQHAKKIISECKKYKVTVIVNHERRYDNKYKSLKTNIQNGIIGSIKTIYASMLTGSYKGTSRLFDGGGPLLHDGTHLIDIIRYLFGDINQVFGSFSRDKRESGFEDKACCWLKANNDIDIFLEAGGSREYFIFELIISGTIGKIIVGNGYQKLYLKSESKFYKGFNDLSHIEYPTFEKNNCFTQLYKEVLEIYNNEEIDSISNINDGLKALEVIHAVYLSAYKKKSIKLPLKNRTVNLSNIFTLKK